MLALKETSEQKKTALKKAVRCQKQRAQQLEAAVEKLTSKIKERVSDYAVSNWESLFCGNGRSWLILQCLYLFFPPWLRKRLL